MAPVKKKAKKSAKPKGKQCPDCPERYVDCHAKITFMGQEICVHDDNLRVYDATHGMPLRTADAPMDFKEERNGRNMKERQYIEENRAKGYTVVRGDDGILRAIGQKGKK